MNFANQCLSKPTFLMNTALSPLDLKKTPPIPVTFAIMISSFLNGLPANLFNLMYYAVFKNECLSSKNAGTFNVPAENV